MRVKIFVFILQFSFNMPNELPYFLPSDVVLHNQPDDIWLSLLGFVYDLTPLIKEYKGRKEIKPLLAYAGKDISHWFNKKTKDVSPLIQNCAIQFLCSTS